MSEIFSSTDEYTKQLLTTVGMEIFVSNYFELKSGYANLDTVSKYSAQNRIVAANTIFREKLNLCALKIVASSRRVKSEISNYAARLYILETSEIIGDGDSDESILPASLRRSIFTMYDFPIGVMLDSFRTDTKTAINKAAEVGALGVQMYSTTGENSPENMTLTRRNEIMAEMKARGLVFSALCGDLGQGFGNAAQNPALIEKSKRILYLAKELGTDIVTTHIGVIPSDKSHERYKIMQDACHTLAEYADSLDAHFAIETGPETAQTLKEFLDALGSSGVAVNLDPANFVMVTGDDPVKAVYTLKKYIVHTHAKDGIKLFDKDPEMIYRVVDDALANLGKAYQELPLGKGSVDFPEYIKALDSIGYKGFLTIEREVGEDPEKDIREAVSFLKNLMNNK